MANLEDLRSLFANTSQSFVSYLQGVVKNNPTSSGAQLFERADVAHYLQNLAVSLHGAIQAAVMDASSSQDDYVQAILDRIAPSLEDFTGDLKARVSEAIDATPQPPSYHQAKGGATNVGLQWGKNKAASIPGAVNASAKTGAYRAYLSVQAAERHGDTEATLASFTEDGALAKKWRANFTNHVPCPGCAYLHGMVVPLDKEFPHPPGVKVFHSLYGPQLHPHCQCHLEKVLPHGLEGPQSSDEQDVESAKNYSPDMVSASSVRDMKPGVFNALLAALSAIIKRFKS